jgi:hypothetical protein
LAPILALVSAWVVAEAYDSAPARRRAAGIVAAALLFLAFAANSLN